MSKWSLGVVAATVLCVGACKQRQFNSETQSTNPNSASDFSKDVCVFIVKHEKVIQNSLHSNGNANFQSLICQKIGAKPSKEGLIKALGEQYIRACVTKENGWSENRNALEDASKLALAGSRDVGKYSQAQCDALFEIGNDIKGQLDSLSPDNEQQERRRQILSLKDLACKDQLPPQNSRDFGEKVCGALGAGARDVVTFQQETNDQFMELQRRCNALTGSAM